MPLRNNKKKVSHGVFSGTKKEQKRVFVDILGGDDFQEYVNFLRSPKRTFFFNFLRGTGFGLGTILGTAIILAIILYIFNLFIGIPVLGDWIRYVLQNLKK